VARRVEVEFGGDRLAAARLAQAYTLLAPQRRLVRVLMSDLEGS